jgi:hypothetical protein
MTTAGHSQGTLETALPSTTKESQALCRARAAVLFCWPTLPNPYGAACTVLARLVRTVLVCTRTVFLYLYCMWDRRSLRERLVSCRVRVRVRYNIPTSSTLYTVTTCSMCVHQ